MAEFGAEDVVVLKATKDEPSIEPLRAPRLFTGDGRVPLETVIILDELRRRESRPPNYEAENRALASLMQEMASSSGSVLQKLVATARNLCGAHSAGISILEEDHGRKIFRWHATAGQWSGFLGSTMPRDISPCGTVLDRNSTLLLSRPERYYPFPPEITPPIIEVLLLPFHVADEPVGTIWIIAHDESRKFDREDQRLMTSLAKFASTAYQVSAAHELKMQLAARKQRQLQRRKEQLAAFFENASVGLHWVGPDGIIQWANPAELEMLGYSQEEYEGHHIGEFHADQEVIDDILGLLVRGEKLKEYEARLRCKDGSIKDVLIDSSVLWDEDRFAHTQCFTRDITHQKQAEAALRESEARFRHMADTAPVMVWVTGRDGLCTYLNKSWYDFTGQTAETALGAGWLDAVHPDERDHVRDPLATAENHEPFRLEYRLRRKNGEYRWTIDTAAPRFGASGKFLGYIGSVIDITERKQAEEAFKQAQQQSEQLNTFLESRVAERTADLQRTIAERERLHDQLLQAQKMESVGTLASGVAHDFNNLLNIILSYATIMRLNGKNPARILEGTSVIEETVKRGATLVQQLMALGRKSETQFDSVGLNKVADKLAGLLTQTFTKTIAITLELEGGLPAINGDENQLHQALLNLCVNARDAMSDGGRISLKTETASGVELRRRYPGAEAERYVAISVSDSGSGMDEVTQRRIFEPFFTTKPVGQGTGVGLAVVYGIVKDHAGFIEVTSRIGQGTTFSVYLPIPRETDGRASETALNATARTPAGQGETILFVDDEEQQLKVMRRFLESEGYRVLSAQDGTEALETFKQCQNEIAVTVLDLGLPKLGGWQVLEQMREVCTELKVLIATGLVSPEVEAEMAQGKLCGVIAKPYQLDDVLEKISQAIHPREG